jgi:hypothetical protein
MALKKEQIRPGMPGYFEKNMNRYRYCNNYHLEGYRCTRVINHHGPHAAHVEMGIAGTTEEIRNEAGEVIEIRVKPGMHNTENLQIATWSKS